MEQTALRPKPMPGGDPGGGPRPSGSTRPSGGVRRPPHAARRRGRRLITVVAGVSAGVVLVLSGVGLGAVGATVIGVSGPADLQRQTGAAGQPRQPSAASEAPRPGGIGAPRPGGSGAPRAGGVTAASGAGPVRPGESERRSVRGTLGVEAVDAPGGAGALIVGVHLPGPGYSAGLVRGDTLLALDGTAITSAADLARAVADAAPGVEVTLRVRHANDSRGQLSAVPGTAT
ncbi:PDZ domain-containing protein [Streptomyces sp. NBC_00151]|uniref:PDZ domain-containing protein n=1 Tax=Streptomyces sp. NBC_00151 TaxID=2975669 RepID=UPI002DD7FD42|nr:PDZ domain-containing protein [Streptomyces sp. NBC_00151]WRZ38811.1 PDZ domain-containing protein [Streptomyces sp. NBC_00151]